MKEIVANIGLKVIISKHPKHPSTTGVYNLAYALSLAYTHTIAYLWSAYYVKYTAVIFRGTEVENVSISDV
jgi:hypothetical protein